MDRTYPCGGYDVGSIPAGSTAAENAQLQLGVLAAYAAAGIEADPNARSERLRAAGDGGE